MRLTKLYIHNYKSFYDTTIELDKMNIVVGENNSGKSNLIDVLEFIDIFVDKDLAKVIVDRGGIKKLLNYNHTEDTILIELALEDDMFKTVRRFTINERFLVVSRITYQKFENELLPIAIISSRVNFKLPKSSVRHFTFEKNMDKVTKNQTKASLAKFSVHFNMPIPITSYVFNIERIRTASHKESVTNLLKNGENLGRNLFEIKQNYPETFELISNSMIGIVNEIDGIDVQQTFGSYLIGFHEPNKEIGIDMVSDGTINLLATITALNQGEDESFLLAFDEPERYLHLKAINYLLENFRTSEKQILITTHSTEILKYANLDEIVFIYRDEDGDTQSMRATEIPDLEGKMERLGYERPLTLDELIATNIIGNFE
jgi:predicted ATPase